MTQSEILTVMVGGFATIAGVVLVAFIGLGIPAGHLIRSSRCPLRLRQPMLGGALASWLTATVAGILAA